MSDVSRTYYGGLYGVDSDDLVQGVVSYLLNDEEIMDIVGIEPGLEIPFIFHTDLLKTMEGTQSNAIVVSYSGDWATDGRSSFKSSRVSFEIYCDPLRDIDGNSTEGDMEARRRLDFIFRSLDRLMNPGSGRTLWMGDCKVGDVTRIGSLSVYNTPDGNGLVRGQVFYGISVYAYRDSL